MYWLNYSTFDWNNSINSHWDILFVLYVIFDYAIDHTQLVFISSFEQWVIIDVIKHWLGYPSPIGQWNANWIKICIIDWLMCVYEVMRMIACGFYWCIWICPCRRHANRYYNIIRHVILQTCKISSSCMVKTSHNITIFMHVQRLMLWEN